MSFLWTVSTILISIAASRLHFRRLTARKGTVVAVVIVFIIIVVVVVAVAAVVLSDVEKRDIVRTCVRGVKFIEPVEVGYQHWDISWCDET